MAFRKAPPKQLAGHSARQTASFSTGGIKKNIMQKYRHQPSIPHTAIAIYSKMEGTHTTDDDNVGLDTCIHCQIASEKRPDDNNRIKKLEAEVKNLNLMLRELFRFQSDNKLNRFSQIIN
eukprot:107840_1